MLFPGPFHVKDKLRRSLRFQTSSQTSGGVHTDSFSSESF